MYTEKSPLTGGQPTYAYQNPHRLYKKQIKQFQCLMCAIVLALFGIALATAVMLSVDDDDIDNGIIGNSSLEGKLQSASPGGSSDGWPIVKPDEVKEPARGPLGKGPVAGKPIKLYTSGVVSKGMVVGGFEGETTSQVFDGTLPVTIPLDPLVDPTSYTPSVPVTWSGVVSNNNTVKGSFSVPFKWSNGSATEMKTFKGDFEIELTFKWSSNLNIVIPNKVYNCKALFLAAYKASFDDSTAASTARSASKGKDDMTTETCTVLLQGSFYEKSFFCYITPWWCTNEKLFYWNGGLEFKIMKPPPPPAPTSVSPIAKTTPRPNLGVTTTKRQPVLNSPMDPTVTTAAAGSAGAKIMGKVINGWLTVQSENGSSNVWNGEVPANIKLPMFYDSATQPSLGYDMSLSWSSTVFSNSIRGTYKVPLVATKLQPAKVVEGSFFFLLEPDPTALLTDVLQTGVKYSGGLHLRDSVQPFNGSKIINFEPRNNTKTTIESTGFTSQIMLFGKRDKLTNSFLWDGTFQMVVTQGNSKAAQDPAVKNDQPASSDNSLPVLGNSLKAPWSSPVVVGSKLIGKVLSGYVSVQDDSGTRTIWDGNFPAKITGPIFYNPTTDVSDLSAEYSHGAVWSCSVFQSSLSGSFQLPQYTKFGLVKWLRGSFLFQIEVDPSWSLYDAIYPGINYNSPIHFRSETSPYNGSKLIQFYSHGTGAGLEDLGFIAPIILIGRNEKTSNGFVWDGRFELIITRDHKSAANALAESGPRKNLQMALAERPMQKNSKKPPTAPASLNAPDANVIGTKILGKVVSGWISVSDTSGTKTIWNGDLPADVTLPIFFNPTTNTSELSDEYGHGAVWSCSVFHSTLKGTYQLPQYTKFGLVKWLKGSFYFQLETGPYGSVYDTIVPGVNYYSPIHFRSAGAGFNETKAINLYSYGEPTPLDDMGFKAPIVLLGQVGKAKGPKSFSWDGRFVMVVKKFF